jgi:hypothetical protein
MQTETGIKEALTMLKFVKIFVLNFFNNKKKWWTSCSKIATKLKENSNQQEMETFTGWSPTNTKVSTVIKAVTFKKVDSRRRGKDAEGHRARVGAAKKWCRARNQHDGAAWFVHAHIFKII